MKVPPVVEEVKERVERAKGQVERLVEHGGEVAQTGAQALKAAKDVVVESAHSLKVSQAQARRAVADAAQAGLNKVKGDAKAIASKAKQDLKRTLKEGYDAVSEKVSKAVAPTRKEQAAAKKAEVKAKKAKARAETEAAELTD